jgi:hypothetical protein
MHQTCSTNLALRTNDGYHFLLRPHSILTEILVAIIETRTAQKERLEKFKVYLEIQSLPDTCLDYLPTYDIDGHF